MALCSLPQVSLQWPRGGVEVQLYSSFNPALVRGGQSMPQPGCFTPGRETQFPIYRRLCRPHGQSGWGRRIFSTPIFDPQTDQHVVHTYIHIYIYAFHRSLRVTRQQDVEHVINIQTIKILQCKIHLHSHIISDTYHLYM